MRLKLPFGAAVLACAGLTACAAALPGPAGGLNSALVEKILADPACAREISGNITFAPPAPGAGSLSFSRKCEARTAPAGNP